VNNFEDTVADILNNITGNKFNGKIFLAAVSGGADSIAMLSSLFFIMQKEPLLNLKCLHVDHGLRAAESRGDADFVKDYCIKLGIDCHVESILPGKIERFARVNGIGIEAAARFYRRRVLFREAKKLDSQCSPGNYTRIFIGHTKDDMLETALMRIFRGAGPEGLAAMPVSRGRILRPLLGLSRADVINYLTEKKIPWREDTTNADIVYLRNRIRHRLIPLAQESFPYWEKNITSLAVTQKLAADFIRKEALQRICWEKEFTGMDFFSDIPSFTTCAENFFSQPEIIREEALFYGINSLLKKMKRKKCGTHSAGFQSSLQFLIPKRSVVRRFCMGLINTADFGALRVKRENTGKITISPVLNDYSDSGFSLLIKEPGLYNLNTISIKVRSFNELDFCTESGYFYALLPLVFKPYYKDDFLYSKGKKITGLKENQPIINASDKLGTAAFIGLNGFLIGRDLPSETDNNLKKSNFFLVEIYKSNRGF
jgi:tRNA(Ile)-lysidine synthase